MTTETRNLALRLSYDGADFAGWQRHPGQRTVQGELEDLLEQLCGGACLVEGAGRTDRGAHALGQVASVRVPVGQDLAQLQRDLRERLPQDLRLTAMAEVDPEFHARKSATGKIYRYVLWSGEDLPEDVAGFVWNLKRPVDVRAMRACLPAFVGTYDFASFTTHGGFERSSTTRTLRRAELTGELPELELILEADGFLYKMVRNLVRLIVKVGEGRVHPREVAVILAACDRKRSPGSAPASGLFLDAVHYERDPFTQAIRP